MRIEFSAVALAASLPLLVNGMSLPVRRNNTHSHHNGTTHGHHNGTASGHNATTHGVNSTTQGLNVTVPSLNSTSHGGLNKTGNGTSLFDGLLPFAQSSAKKTPNPVYNLNNKSCTSLNNMNSSLQWDAISGDKVVSTFQDMFDNNKLVCNECFGKSKDECDSDSDECQNGLQDLSKADGKNPRWDRAAAHFAQDVDLNDLICSIQQGECGSAPVCSSCNGPGSWAILKSLETLNNQMNNVYRAVLDAGAQCTDQMTQFSNVFAPIPTPPDNTFLNIMMSIIGGVVGFIPGVGGEIAGVLNDVGSSVLSDVMASNPPEPGDTASILGFIMNQTAQQYIDVTNSLFADGSYTAQSADGIQVHEISLGNMMKNGALMQQTTDGDGLYSSLIGTYQKILYQQLAVFTWQNMQNDNKGHMPYITFAPGPCSSVKDDSDQYSKAGLKGINGLNVGYDYKGNCYWLLDAFKDEDYHPGGFEQGGYETDYCGGVHALPGGNNGDFASNSDTFAGLSLGDFIVPAVEGWLAHSKSNEYSPAAQDGKLVSDPRAAGAINIPVCDFLGNAASPGVNCPKIGGSITDKGFCDVWPRNSVPNAPGAYAPGWCVVHVDQYQRREGDENPLSVYQLEVAVYDDAGRQVADAVKQPAGSPLEIRDTSLPFNLILVPGAGDSDPVQFWYADQFWDSNSDGNHCKVGGYDGGMRQMDCGFNCPYVHAGDQAPVSATQGHKLPGAPTPAVAGVNTYVNTFVTATPTPTPTGPPPPPPKPTYAQGACGVHVRQHQKNEGSQNPTGDYEVEVTIYDANHNVIGTSGDVQAPNNKAVNVNGLVDPFTVTAGAVDDDPLRFSFNGQNWDSNGQQCKVGGYDSGHRDMDCGFTC